MKVYKYIKDGKLYIIQALPNSDVEKSIDGVKYTAIPYSHDGGILINVNIKDFIPIISNGKNR